MICEKTAAHRVFIPDVKQENNGLFKSLQSLKTIHMNYFKYFLLCAIVAGFLACEKETPQSEEVIDDSHINPISLTDSEKELKANLHLASY